MTTAAKAAEADAVTVAFQVAMTRVGVVTVAEALKLWESVPVSNRPALASQWMSEALTLIMSQRSITRELARAYFRLARALRTGRTIADPRNPDPTSVSLSQLRYEFKRLAGPDAPPDVAGDASIPVERINGMSEDAARRDREADTEIRTALGNLGPLNLQKKLDALDPATPIAEADPARQSAHDEAGARQAAAAERIALNGGREELQYLAQKDKRAIGWIRLSRTGTPCGWCAMLISRGPVYKSERAATNAGMTDEQYHDNCHCYAIPVWTVRDYKTSDLYALNREYEALWPQVTKGLSGKAAVSAWRRFIRQEQRAQAVRSTTSVQEA